MFNRCMHSTQCNQLPNKFIIINELLIDYIWIKNLELVEDHHVVHEIIIIYNV